MGFCLYGNDINDTTSPLEAGLGWITKFTKEFTNSENLKKQKVSRAARPIGLIPKAAPASKTLFHMVSASAFLQ